MSLLNWQHLSNVVRICIQACKGTNKSYIYIILVLIIIILLIVNLILYNYNILKWLTLLGKLYLE